MSPVVIITDNIDLISVDNLARQIKAVADGLGVPCERVKPGKPAIDAMNHARVINLKEGEMTAYAGSFRWVHPRAMASVIAGNWDDYSDADRLHMLGHLLKPNYAGVPFALVAHSPYTLNFIKKTVRELLAPSAGRAVLSNVHLIPCGIEDGFAPGDNDPDMLVVPFNHPVGLKQVPLHAKTSLAYSVMRLKQGQPEPVHQVLAPSDHGVRRPAARGRGGLLQAIAARHARRVPRQHRQGGHVPLHVLLRELRALFPGAARLGRGGRVPRQAVDQ